MSDERESSIQFLKGGESVFDSKRNNSGADLKTDDGRVSIIQKNLSDALNCKNIAFLFGAGCSSFWGKRKEDEYERELGIPTVMPLAKEFIGSKKKELSEYILTDTKRREISEICGIDVTEEPYKENLEELMNVLESWGYVLEKSKSEHHKKIQRIISKLKKFLYQHCTKEEFTKPNPVQNLYEAFYRKLIYRNKALPRPWIFTTNYDLFNERAMDRLGIPYTNGFSGIFDRRFNPAVFRYSLAEQVDLISRKWAAVDNFVYLCKLHGSVSWVEDDEGLFRVKEQQNTENYHDRLMIYPSSAKYASSLASPYMELFREFQHQIVREQTVLFVLGYSFGDAHINNIIYQALTIPTFRLVIFADVNELPQKINELKELRDSRIWLIGGEDKKGDPSHYFKYFAENLMPPELPESNIDQAVEKIENLIIRQAEAGKRQKRVKRKIH